MRESLKQFEAFSRAALSQERAPNPKAPSANTGGAFVRYGGIPFTYIATDTLLLIPGAYSAVTKAGITQFDGLRGRWVLCRGTD